MKFQIQETDHSVWLSFQGELNISCLCDIRDLLNEVAASGKNILLDLDENSVFDISFIQLLLYTAHNLLPEQKFTITKQSEHLLRLRLGDFGYEAMADRLKERRSKPGDKIAKISYINERP